MRAWVMGWDEVGTRSHSVPIRNANTTDRKVRAPKTEQPLLSYTPFVVARHFHTNGETEMISYGMRMPIYKLFPDDSFCTEAGELTLM
jgi:hypothetical protein